MSKTYHLTTPLMGTHNRTDRASIKALQRLLVKHGYLNAVPDGIYGTHTAQAVYRAKYWLGYPTGQLDHNAGDMLYGLLSGKTAPGTLFKANAAARKHHAKAAAAATPIATKALNFLISHNGIKEHPAGSNRCVVSAWYGLVGPWCAMTGVWAYAHAGSKTFTLDKAHRYNWAFVPNILADARRGVHGLSVTHTPKPGDGVCYDWPGESPGLADHYGTFEKWIVPGKTFYSREGNTAVGNDSNGGELMQRERSVSNVLGFVVIHG